MPKKQFLVLCVLLLHQVMFGQYMGSASVTQGLATITASNLYTCTNGRVTDIGMITANDASVWTVPASVNFTNNTFHLHRTYTILVRGHYLPMRPQPLQY